MTRITELTPLLKRLQLGPMAATLPERIALARRGQLNYASFLEIILSDDVNRDEVNRRAHRRIELRLQGAGFEETCRLDDFDWSASITLDRRLLDAVFSLEFLDKHEQRPPGRAGRRLQELPGSSPGLPDPGRDVPRGHRCSGRGIQGREKFNGTSTGIIARSTRTLA